jgi:hypothetical protein
MGGDGSGFRRVAAALLALIAGVSFTVGVASLEARQTLFEPGDVQDLSSRLLDQAAVRSAIALTLTTRLRSLEPALEEPAVSGGLDQLATAFAGTDRFRRTFTGAVARLQSDLLAAGDPHVALRLDAMLGSTLGALQDELGITVPIPQGSVTGVLPVDPDQVQAYRRLEEVTGDTGWPAIVIGGLSAIGAVLVAGRRRSAILGVGAAVAFSALVALGALVLTQSVAASRADTSTSRGAIDAAWEVMVPDVRTGLTVVLLAGLGTAVAGLALQAFRGGRVAS